MTSNHSHHHAARHDRPGHGPAPENDSDLAELLDLDARFGASVLAGAIESASDLLDSMPLTVVDLGAGTGSGTLALAAAYPLARVHSLDASQTMLDHLRARAEEQGVAARVETQLVDLDGDWPAVVPGGVDLVWAALSLHHTSDPVRVLRQAFDVLRPGGVVVVTEFSGVTAYDPAGLGTTRDGLGERIVTALAARGYPVAAEWTDALAATGFGPVARREMEHVVTAGDLAGARYLELQLSRNRELIADDLEADDLAALDAVIAALGQGRSHLCYSSGRVVWVGVRPSAEVGR